MSPRGLNGASLSENSYKKKPCAMSTDNVGLTVSNGFLYKKAGRLCTRLLENFKKNYNAFEALSMRATKLSAFNAAPPIRPPSMSFSARSASAFSGFIEPP